MKLLQVLVMDAGNVVELDHPHILLQKTNGFLSNMVERTGAGMAENLKKVAREVCLLLCLPII